MVQEFEEGDGVFARDSGEFLEFGDGQLTALEREQLLSQAIDRGVVEDEFVVDAEESFFAHQNLQEGAGSRGFDSGSGEGFVDGGDGESRFLEGGFDADAGFSFFLLEDHAVGPMAHDIAFDRDLRMVEDGVQKC